jgi:hypothetical protein
MGGRGASASAQSTSRAPLGTQQPVVTGGPAAPPAAAVNASAAPAASNKTPEALRVEAVNYLNRALRTDNLSVVSQRGATLSVESGARFNTLPSELVSTVSSRLRAAGFEFEVTSRKVVPNGRGVRKARASFKITGTVLP